MKYVVHKSVPWHSRSKEFNQKKGDEKVLALLIILVLLVIVPGEYWIIGLGLVYAKDAGPLAGAVVSILASAYLFGAILFVLLIVYGETKEQLGGESILVVIPCALSFLPGLGLAIWNIREAAETLHPYSWDTALFDIAILPWVGWFFSLVPLSLPFIALSLARRGLNKLRGICPECQRGKMVQIERVWSDSPYGSVSFKDTAYRCDNCGYTKETRVVHSSDDPFVYRSNK